MSVLPSAIDSPDMRSASAEMLSVGLMDARNHLLWLWDQLAGGLQAPRYEVPERPDTVPPLWWLGHAGWFQEWWVARNLQRERGRHAERGAVRLASVEPRADAWWSAPPAPGAARADWYQGQPGAEATRAYLLGTLETTLELLDKAAPTDEGLYAYRLALWHEDSLAEELATLAQTLALPLKWALPGPMPLREPLWVPAARWRLGQDLAQGGLVPDLEAPAHAIDVPEFEIDTQTVSWSQFVEFVDDGGYDREELWQPRGWAWLQQRADGGRAPRYVEQIGVASGAVMQTRFGVARRLLGNQPVMHLSWWEADAWCRWAGRRLPAEVEWEMAALSAGRRGFRWGDTWEWTATGARTYPGFVPGPAHDPKSVDPGHKVLRGASFATRARQRSAKARRFASPDADHLFVGFRSCAL